MSRNSPQDYTELTPDEDEQDLAAFRDAAALDTLKDLGPMSKEEHDYYMNLPAGE